MVRRILILSALAAVLVPSADAARQHVSLTTTELMPGVTYTREVDLTAAGPVVLDIVTLPKPDGTVYSLQPVLSNEKIGGTETLTHIEQRLDTGATTVGIDGDYFNGKTGAPSSILMRDGTLDTAPNPGRSSLGIASDGTLQIATVSLAGTWQANGGLRRLALNDSKARFTLYTPAYGSRTPASLGATEVAFSSFPATQPGRALDAVVTQVTQTGGTPIPRGGAVLVGHGSTNATQLLTEAPVGRQIEIRLTLTPDWSDLVGAIGGGPLLVANGQAVFPGGESFLAGTLDSRDARGAVGQTADGHILLVTVEKGTVAYSVGVSSSELALEMARLGATSAVALGAGRGSGIAFNGKLLTRPSGKKQVGISDALVLSYSGVYAAPVAPVLSPNGDGVADTETLSYRVVRPSTVTVTLSGPGGTTIQLANGPVPAGVQTLTWDGDNGPDLAPEGAWTFTVSATDDHSVTTTAERPFSLDDTLGAVTVSRNGSGYPTANFTLTRPADVVVTVESRSGAPVATVETASLAQGAHHATWRGRAAGRRAPAGPYLMRVEATSDIGTTSLVLPFSLASHLGK